MADDVTAGIRAAAFGGSQMKSPLEMATQAASLGNMLTRNQLMNQSILNSQQELENLKLTQQTGEYDLAVKAIDEGRRSLASVLSQDDLTGEKGYSAYKTAALLTLQNHPGSAQAAQATQTLINSIPPPTQSDGSPTSDRMYRQFGNQHNLALVSAKERLDALRSNFQFQQAGNRVITIQTPSEAEQVISHNRTQPVYQEAAGPTTGPVPLGAPPKMEQVFVRDPKDPTGKTGKWLFQPVVDQETGGGAAPPAAGAAPPPAGGPPPQPAAPVAPGGPAAPTGPIVTAQRQQESAPPLGAGAQVEKNIEAYNTDVAKLPQSWTRIRVAKQAMYALSQAETGKGTQDWYNLGQTLQSWGWVPDGSAWAKQINSQAEAVKLLSQLITSNPSIASDLRLQEISKGSATTGIPNLVSRGILRDNIIAPERMFIAQVEQTTDPQNYTGGNAPGINDYANHRSNYNISLGTSGQLAYAWDDMNDAEKNAVLESLAKHPKLEAQFKIHYGLSHRLFFPDLKE